MKKEYIFDREKKLPVTITTLAQKKILEVRESKKIPDDYYLRLGVKSVGCGIASYVIGFDHFNEKDELFELDELKVIIEKIQVLHLAGKSVDYGETDGETGFIFKDKS